MLGSIEVTRARRVYCYDGLSPDAQRRAIETIREWLAGDYDYDGLHDFLSGTLAAELGTPPDDVTAMLSRLNVEADLSYRQGDGVRFTGKLSREDAPLLSWPDGVDYVLITPMGGWHVHESSFTIEYVRDDDFGYDPFAESGPSSSRRFAGCNTGHDGTPAQCRIFHDQVMGICRDMRREGYRWIEDAENALVEYHLTEHPDTYRWNEDGTFAPFAYWQGGRAALPMPAQGDIGALERAYDPYGPIPFPKNREDGAVR